MHRRSLHALLSQHLRTSLPPLLSNFILFGHLIVKPLSLILITRYLQHYSLDWPLPHLQLYSNYVNHMYVQVLSIMTAVLLVSLIYSGSNFVPRQIYDQLPLSIRNLNRPTNRVVRLGDSRSLPVNLEVPLMLAIPDSLGHIHAHSTVCLMFSVMMLS